MLSGRRPIQQVRKLVLFNLIVLALAAASLAQPRTILGQTDPLSDPAEQAFRFQEEDFPEFDGRTGAVTPTQDQLSAVSALGARARWNAFGSPRSLMVDEGFLATGLSGDPESAVRSWLGANSGLFQLSAADVAGLELLHNVELVDSPARALLFRQRFDGHPAAQDGLVAVGYVNGSIGYASASTAGWNGASLGTAGLSPAEAWLQAAADVGRAVNLADVTNVGVDDDWTLLSVPGFAQVQRARVRALPTPTDGVKLVYETIVLHSFGGEALAFTHMVDANTGAIIVRHNRKQHFEGQAAALAAPTVSAFSGTFGQTTCATPHDFAVGTGNTSISVLVNAVVPANDIKIALDYNGATVASADTLTSPEGIVYAPAGGIPAGTYSVVVCPYDSSSIAPRDYLGNFITDDTPLPDTSTYPPKWNIFQANPPLDLSNTDTRELACWEAVVEGSAVPGCELELKGDGEQPVWDVNPRTGTPTFTTVGNNAQTAQSWYSFLTPSAPYRPVSAGRAYNFPWTNAWQTSKCSQTVFATPNGNDTDAATANLFALHNRMHDWSYRLGFREETYNLQESNRGAGNAHSKEHDPEIGNVQAGAVTGGSPTYTGRDNANQITLNDGIAPITNMYLWQPIASAFYAPCVDGDYDMSVIAHEYGHAIQNRMVAGPDAGLSGHQARSMGESWSDLTAIEFLNGYGLVPVADENPFAVGPYVTGAKQTGIRNYGMNASPLNFSNLDYDGNGTTSPHADGEIWSATNFDIRQALINKYNAQYPASDQALQQACADGKVSVHACPGNRRWAQIFHDAFLLMQSGVSMDDARDAYLAADFMRAVGTPNNAWPSNQAELWRSFARRGLGIGAESRNAQDRDPRISFESPKESNGTVTFKLTAADERNGPVSAKVYVGDYEARAVPVADTDPNTPLADSAKFVSGTYSFTIVAPGYGQTRVSNVAVSGSKSQTVKQGLRTNYASSHQGATAFGDGTGHTNLIDDTEATNWARLNAPSIAGSTVTVDLAGAAQTIRYALVSAALRPAEPNNPSGDTRAQNRFTALRQFELWACDANDPAKLSCAADASFTKVFTSPADAFPAGLPRPTAPTLRMRGFDIPATTATHVQLRVVTNQCTGGPAYQGEQDNDPVDVTDCDTGTIGGTAATAGLTVRAAELQLFGTRP